MIDIEMRQIDNPRWWQWARAVGQSLALLAFVAVLGLLLSLALTRAPLFGYRAVILAGPSMEPALDNGSLLISRQVDPEDLAVGDVMTFRYPNTKKAVTHRIVDVQEEDGRLLFTTKGDHNLTPDSSYVNFDNGQPYKMVFSVPYVGRLLALIQNPAVLALGGLVTLATVAALRVVDEGEKRRRARAESSARS